MELALCHPDGAHNVEMTSKFLGTLYISDCKTNSRNREANI